MVGRYKGHGTARKLVRSKRRIIKRIVQTYGTQREKHAASGKLTKKTGLGREKRKTVARAYRKIKPRMK